MRLNWTNTQVTRSAAYFCAVGFIMQQHFSVSSFPIQQVADFERFWKTTRTNKSIAQNVVISIFEASDKEPSLALEFRNVSIFHGFAGFLNNHFDQI